MMVYVSGSAGRAAYAKARAKSKPRRRAADPQAPAAVPADPRIARDILMLPCITPVPGGVCGTPALGHEIGKRNGKQVRTYCCLITAAGACPCQMYTRRMPEESKLTKK